MATTFSQLHTTLDWAETTKHWLWHGSCFQQNLLLPCGSYGSLLNLPSMSLTVQWMHSL